MTSSGCHIRQCDHGFYLLINVTTKIAIIFDLKQFSTKNFSFLTFIPQRRIPWRNPVEHIGSRSLLLTAIFYYVHLIVEHRAKVKLNFQTDKIGVGYLHNFIFIWYFVFQLFICWWKESKRSNLSHRQNIAIWWIFATLVSSPHAWNNRTSNIY